MRTHSDIIGLMDRFVATWWQVCDDLRLVKLGAVGGTLE